MHDKSKEGNVQPSILDNVFAPEVYADCAIAFSTKTGNVCVTFASYRFDNSTADPATAKPIRGSNVVIGRLVMPPMGAHLLAVGLFDYLKKSGFQPDPSGHVPN